MPPRTPSSAASSQGTSSTPSLSLTSAAAAPTFSNFMLERIARNPFLINETPQSLRPSPPASSSSSSLQGGSSAATTLDAAQRTVLLNASTTPDAKSAGNGVAATSNAAAVTALLQRAIVDSPLLPVGNTHLLHELVWANFVVCAEAAKQVGTYRAAMAMQEARRQQEELLERETRRSDEANTAATLPATTTTAAEEMDSAARIAELAASVFGTTPLTAANGTSSPSSPSPSPSSPTSASAAATPSNTNNNNSNNNTPLAGDDLRSAEDISTTLTSDALQARLTQSEARLAECRREVQRGLQKLRLLSEKLQAYDGRSVDVLRRQTRETVAELMRPVDATVCVSGEQEGTVEGREAGEGESEQSRKRQRDVE